MKLSEAILRGCERTEQCFGRYFANGKACALGAAALGAGIKRSLLFWPLSAELDKAFPELQDMVPLRLSRRDETLSEWVYRRNDQYRWPRERIAGALAEHGL